MKIQEIEELYKDALQSGGKFDDTAEKMVDELTPKEIVSIAQSDLKSLHWNPEGNELPALELLRDYIYNHLKEMGDYLTDANIKVDPLEK